MTTPHMTREPQLHAAAATFAEPFAGLPDRGSGRPAAWRGRVGPWPAPPLLFVLQVLCLAGPTGSAPQELSYTIVDTGQDTCHGTRRRIEAPALGERFFGQDAQYLGNAPAYRDAADGTIVDLNTGLVWQKTPDSLTRSWADAAAYADTLELGGHSDWRLPTIKELFSIADLRGNMRTRTPYVDTRFFDFEYPTPGAGVRDMDAQYWSADLYVGTTMRDERSAFGFNFADGRIKSYPLQRGRARRGSRAPHVKKYARCVRGAPYGVNDFVDNGDGTVTDRATGLQWAKADSGEGLNWEQALRHAEDLELAGFDDWRLPDVKELQSIVDYTRAPDARSPSARGAAIDPIFGVTEAESWFWSSTTHLEHRAGAYYVCFGRALSARKWAGEEMNAHGAGAVRSDPKVGDPADWPDGLGPQGDQIRILNYARAVRGGVPERRP
ncbi:MAG: DUF1566 domain-containing protein [bacterium]|nr:DUF1566 domain-containing protein [bacterium]